MDGMGDGGMDDGWMDGKMDVGWGWIKEKKEGRKMARWEGGTWMGDG